MRLTEVQGRVANMEELLALVEAMRSLAGMHLHAATHALEAVRRYAEAMTQAIRDALTLALDNRASAPGERARGATGRALIVCTTEHGFVGGLNDRLLQTAATDLLRTDMLLVLGSRGVALATERGHRVHWQHPMPTRVASIPSVVRQIESHIYSLIAHTEAVRVEVIFGRLQQNGVVAIERRQLFPLELPAGSARSASLPPMHNLPAGLLLEQLTGEYILAQLMEAATESLASENAARFATMQAAQDHATQRLGKLRQLASEARQEEITSDLLDLMTGELAVVDRRAIDRARLAVLRP
jgi:F-type H+-transporting ATPase subunit gamma